MMTRERAVPLAMAALLAIASALILIEAPGYREVSTGEPGPAAMPILVVILSLTTATGLIIQSLRGKYDEQESQAGRIGRALLTGITLLVIPFVMPHLGSFAAFTVALAVMGVMAGAKRVWLALVVAAVSSWIVLFVFQSLLSVPFPVSVIDRIVGL